MISNLVSIALKNVSHRKARSLLTVTGIAIGIAAVVALITIGNSLTLAVSDQLEQLGSDKVFIVQSSAGSGGLGPPSGTAATLTDSDLDEIENLKSVDKVVPALVASLPVTYKGETRSLLVRGIPAKDAAVFFSDVQIYDMEEGRFLEDAEKTGIVTGNLLKNDVFSEEVRVRSKLELLDSDYRVVGMFGQTGNQQYDTSITMTIEAMRDLLDKKDEITAMVAKVNGEPKEAAEDIEKILEDNHGEDLFIALTSDQLIERINSVFSVMSVVLGGIAAISLIVAAFGIMNTMLMSVMERTKEIGTLKAVGAQNKDIILLFLIESSIVGMMGGIMGVVIGFGITIIIAGTAQSIIGITVAVYADYGLMMFAIFFAAAIGIISGTYPAYKAAKLNPVEALRYE
ncbi:MAG: ABC transporter permease [Candidatus Aenigmarchaeota archaeon]|nr:ABC transporter permease [Candidatus Aenigmarchaeota archaeon]